MLHPLFSTLIQRPDLVMDHASAYAALFNQEAKTAGWHFLKRGFAWVMAGISGIIFFILTGSALMLGFIQNQFHWILVIVPGLALLMTVIAIMVAKKPLPFENFPQLKEQFDSDASALRTAS